jgi:hypothetical protein
MWFPITVGQNAGFSPACQSQCPLVQQGPKCVQRSKDGGLKSIALGLEIIQFFLNFKGASGVLLAQVRDESTVEHDTYYVRNPVNLTTF